MATQNSSDSLTRRDAAWALARAASAAGASSFFSQWLRAAQVHSHASGAHAPPEPDRWTGYQPKFFSPPEFQMLDAFTAILIPSDDTPGAREAHVPDFIDFVVNAASEYAKDVQEDWRSALQWLDSRQFAALSDPQKVDLVTAMSEPEHDPTKTHEGFHAYRLIKEMTVQAFYTSRAGLVDVLEYQGIAYLTEFPACTHPEHHKV